MGVCAGFAKQDMWSGEDLYASVFTFIVTEGINSNFELFGSDNMVMMTNSGSFFILLFQILLICFILTTINKLAVKLAKYKCMRVIGTYVYKSARYSVM